MARVADADVGVALATVLGVEFGVYVGVRVKKGVGTRVDVVVWVANNVGRNVGVKICLDTAKEVDIVVDLHPESKLKVIIRRQPDNTRGYRPKNKIVLE